MNSFARKCTGNIINLICDDFSFTPRPPKYFMTCQNPEHLPQSPFTLRYAFLFLLAYKFLHIFLELFQAILLTNNPSLQVFIIQELFHMDTKQST